nr:hypothetical protein [uncultured Rhodoferax sp.]
MSQRTDLYTAVTPFGAIAVEFPEEGGSIFTGPIEAVEYVQSIMARNCNSMGIAMTIMNLEPSDFVGFCQPQGSGIIVIEPFDSLLAHGVSADDVAPVLDSVDRPIERIRKAKDIFDSLRTVG